MRTWATSAPTLACRVISRCTAVLALLGILALAQCGKPSDTLPDHADLAVVDLTIPFPSGCSNGVTDNDESDVDCGGSCTPCAVGKTCNLAKDCQSAICVNRTCILGDCSDLVKNNDETDVDCGGSCSKKCAEGQRCKDGVDCQSGSCSNNICGRSPCSNMQQDGMETDVDCGGPTCAGCPDGKICKDGSDCIGMMCVNNVCAGGGDCMNMKKDGAETDVDCGGGMCGKCADGKSCGGNADCQSASCSKGVCCAKGYATCGNGGACATWLQYDSRNCGGCGVTCPNGQLCAAGKCKIPSVLVVGSEAASPQNLVDIQQKLQGTGAFERVDTFNSNKATPMVAQLQMYDCVLVYKSSMIADSVALGDNLASYFDGGGRVVTTMGSFELVGTLKGRFGEPANGYIFVKPDALISSSDSLGRVLEPMSPLMKDVQALSANRAIRTSGMPVNGGIVVAEWAGMQGLIIRGTVKGRNRVDLNLFPHSSDVNPDFWRGDGAAIMRNALLFQ